MFVALLNSSSLSSKVDANISFFSFFYYGKWIGIFSNITSGDAREHDSGYAHVMDKWIILRNMAVIFNTDTNDWWKEEKKNFNYLSLLSYELNTVTPEQNSTS